MRTNFSSVGMAALFGSVFLCASLASVPQSATAAVFNVTESTWGVTTTPGSFAWAIDQANTQPGPDTISIAAGLEINVDVPFGLPGDLTWLANFTESVNVQGNGAKLIGNPTYVTSGSLFATKTNIVGNAYRPAIRSTDFVVQRALSFAKIGTFGADNSSIEVTFTDLSADGLASISNVYEGAQLSVSGGDFDNIVNYSQTDDTGRGAFEAYAGSMLNLNDISITRSYPFANALDVNDEAALFFGTIQGVDAQLNMANSSINSSYGAGAVAWSGGTANIVSSVIKNAGGLQINQGVLNFVNSILYMTGGDSLSQTNRIQAASGGEANITASSILYDPLSTSVSCANVSYECNGMPLTALLNGVLNFDSSVAVAINTSLAFPGKDSYREYTGGDLRADQYSFIGATDNQDASAVRALFDNPSILTEGDTYGLQDNGIIQFFNELPFGAFPLPGGVLAGVIPNADSGSFNELINPIDGQPILVDVYGLPRTNAAGSRDIGAVQGAAQFTPYLVVTAVGDGAVDLSWNRPADPPSGVITGYDVCYSTGTPPDPESIGTTCPGGTLATISTNSAVVTGAVTGLTNGTLYWFLVRGVNPAPGPWSNAVQAIPLGTVQAPVVTATAGNGQATLSWTTPDAGGNTITGYTVAFRQQGTVVWTTYQQVTGNTTDVFGLINGVTYEFAAITRTTGGDSDLSAPVSATPSGPGTTTPPLSANSGDGQVSLTWLPTTTGGVVAYRVRYRIGEQLPWTVLLSQPSSQLTALVTGLANGVIYNFQVEALGSTGEVLAASNITSATPEAVIPSPTPVPALSGWALALLAGMLALVAVRGKRRNQAAGK